jgi:hypothetical protein
MQQVGFRPVWRDIIIELLLSSSAAVLLNGIPNGFIQHREDYVKVIHSLQCSLYWPWMFWVS